MKLTGTANAKGAAKASTPGDFAAFFTYWHKLGVGKGKPTDQL